MKSEMQIIEEFLGWCGMQGYALVKSDTVLDVNDRVHYERAVNEFLDSKRLGEADHWQPQSIVSFLSDLVVDPCNPCGHARVAHLDGVGKCSDCDCDEWWKFK